MVQLSITKLPVREAQLGLDLKCLFIPNANFLISCSEEAYRVPDLGSAANLKEPLYLVVLASGRRSKSLWRVLYEWKSREWLEPGHEKAYRTQKFDPRV